MRRFREPTQTNEGVSAVSRKANDLAFRGAIARSESGGPDIQPARHPNKRPAWRTIRPQTQFCDYANRLPEQRDGVKEFIPFFA